MTRPDDLLVPDGPLGPDEPPAARHRSSRIVAMATGDLGRVLGIYALSRVVTLAWVATAGAFVGEAGGDGRLTTLLSAWDGEWYLRVAEHGYPDHVPVGADGLAVESELVFFPAFPMLIRLVASVTPLDTRGAGFVVVLLAGAAATLAVWWLASQHLDRPAAVAAAALFCFAPGAFALSFLYSEGVLVAGSAAAITLARKERWVLAGLAGAVATAARPTGFVVVVALALVAFEGSGARRWWAPALATTGVAGFFLVVGSQVGELDFWFRVERDAWDAHLDFGLTSMRQILGLDPPMRGTVALNLTIVTTVLALGLVLVAVRQRLARPELVYSVLVLAFAFGSGAVGLRPRMLLAAFPLVIPLARWIRPPALPYVLVASATLMGATAALSSVTDFTLP